MADFETIEDLKQEWKRSLPDFTTLHLLEIFPTSRQVFKKSIKSILNFQKEKLEKLFARDREFSLIIANVPYQHRYFFEAIKEEYSDKPIAELKQKIKRNAFL